MNRISPDIRVGELHAWIADLDAILPTGRGVHPCDPLSADERERAARFWNPRDGARWARSRLLLRLLLGGYLGANPEGLCFEQGERGKPRLASGPDGGGQDTLGGAQLHFNLSHSGGVGLYVFALECEVGCDVERPGRDIDVLAVAERALGQEVVERLRALGEREREAEFLRSWVRHEAVLKCLGVGLGAAAKARAQECWMIDVELDEPVTVAVAAEHAPVKVECRRWNLAGSEPVSDRAMWS